MKIAPSSKAYLFPIILFIFIDLSANADIYSQVSSNTWHFLIAPYGWLAGLNGDIKVRDDKHKINITFQDVLKHLQFSAEGHAEAGYGPITLMLDPTYLRLTKHIHESFLREMVSFDTKITNQTTLVDAGIFLRLLTTPMQDASLELLGGARYLDEKNSFDFPLLPLRFAESDNNHFTVPIVGGRLKYAPSSKAFLWLRGDVGGFNVDNIRSTWSESAGFAYTIYPHIALGAAYRMLGIDFAKRNSSANIIMHGPMLGIAFYS